MNLDQAAQLLPKIRETLECAAPEWSISVDQKTGHRLISTRESLGFPLVAVAKLAVHPPFDDAELIVNAYRYPRALVMLLDRRTEQLAEARREIERLRAEIARAKAPKQARDCAMLCADVGFQDFLIERHGLEGRDKNAAADQVRSILNIPSRKALDEDQAAAARWHNLKKDFRKWQNQKN